jgi:hypothetical protein
MNEDSQWRHDVWKSEHDARDEKHKRVMSTKLEEYDYPWTSIPRQEEAVYVSDT